MSEVHSGRLGAPNDELPASQPVPEPAEIGIRRLHHGEPSSAPPSRSARDGATPSRGPRSLGVDAVVPGVRRVEAGAAAPASGAANPTADAR